MGTLSAYIKGDVYHYAPLHYLPFICRAEKLLSKPRLLQAGFNERHLRSMSHRQDMARGFGQYVFLTLNQQARILCAKLEAGFPHIGIGVPCSAIEATDYGLCRFNVAMTRSLRKDGKPGFPESATNGRYYGEHQIPIAMTDADKSAMLHEHLPRKTTIEVLIDGELKLPADTNIVCFADDDMQIVARIMTQLGCPWGISVKPAPGPYNRKPEYVRAVGDFIDAVLADPEWLGNGLEFDRVEGVGRSEA